VQVCRARGTEGTASTPDGLGCRVCVCVCVCVHVCMFHTCLCSEREKGPAMRDQDCSSQNLDFIRKVTHAEAFGGGREKLIRSRVLEGKSEH
jgi:hypothetical protein